MSSDDPSKPVVARSPQLLRIDKDAQIKIYGANLSLTRDKRVLWMLEELGVAYELIEFDLLKGEHVNADYLRIHPSALVPAVQVGEFYMLESAGIVMVLADHFADRGLAPPSGHVERPAYVQWMFYGAATLEAVTIHMMHSYPSGLKPDPEELHNQLQLFDRYVITLEKVLEERDYLLDFGFSAADISIGWNLAFAQHIGLIGQYPTLKRYYDRLAARPAFKAAFPEDDLV